MKNHKALIIVGGAAAAYYILKSKSAGGLSSANKPGLLNTLFPKAATPGITGTNMATRGGVATTARVPSSSLGYGGTALGAAARPSTVGGIVQGSEGLLSSIFGYLTKTAKPGSAALPAGSAPKPSTASPGGGSPGGGSSAGNGGGASRPGVNPGMGGSAGLAGQSYSNGYFDDNGNWQGYSGYYDSNGNFVQMNADGTLPGLDDQGEGGLYAQVPDLGSGSSSGIDFTQFGSGATDENGYYDPYADSGLEVIPSGDDSAGSGYDNSQYYDDGSGGGVLPSSDTVPYDSSQAWNVDPVVFDQGNVTGYPDDLAVADGVGDDSANSGYDNSQYYDYSYDESGGGGNGQNDFSDGTTYGDF